MESTTRTTGSAPSSVRQANLALILGLLRSRGPASRAQLAAITGISKSATSSIVGDLLGRSLIQEGPPRRNGHIGRPGLDVTLRGDTVCGIGLDIAPDSISAVALDLAEKAHLRRRHTLPDHSTPETALKAAAELLDGLLEDCRTAELTPVAVVVSVSGTVDHDTGTIRHSAPLGWHDVHVCDTIRAHTGLTLPLAVENDSRLSAIAEYAALRDRGIRHLVCLTGTFGIAAGVISDGALIRGRSGRACEIGHLPLSRTHRPCPCGRRYCWERGITLPMFLAETVPAEDPLRSPDLTTEERLAALTGRLDAGDSRLLAALPGLADELATGVSLLQGLFDPETIVVGGWLGVIGEYLLPLTRDRLTERGLFQETETSEVTASVLSLDSSLLGAARLALEAVFEDPTRVGSRLPA